MRLSKVAVLALIVGAAGSMSASSRRWPLPTVQNWWNWRIGARTRPATSASRPEQSCLFPITMRGTVTSSDILQKPAHGKLKKLNATTYEYKAKARYKGSDTFAIKATGQGPTASGTSVITVHATIK